MIRTLPALCVGAVVGVVVSACSGTTPRQASLAHEAQTIPPPSVAAAVTIPSQANQVWADPSPAPLWPKTVRDAYIIDFFGTANAAERQEAELARDRAVYDRVRAYADRIEADHRALQDETERLSKSLDLKPAFSPRSRHLQTEHHETMTDLEQKTGAAFDASYIEHNIRLHQRILEKLEQSIREARHPEVKRLLNEAKPELQAHLSEAEMIQESLLSGSRTP